MMNTFTVELAYGEAKKIVLNGKYLKGLARAVEGGQPSADAELLLLTDDSEEKAEVLLNYSENGSMNDRLFDQMSYTNLMDVLQFNYIRDNITRTGIVIVEKV
jgi:hypothetical protein